jgi:hypothetical protein
MTDGISMGIYCTPMLAYLFLYYYEAEFIQKLLHENNKPLVVAFNLTFRSINDVLSINNDHFHSHVDSLYLSELEIKDTTESSASASYFDVLLKKHNVYLLRFLPCDVLRKSNNMNGKI